MDKILLGILNSTHADNVKVSVIEKICGTEQNARSIAGILGVCIEYFQQADLPSVTVSEAVDKMFMHWIKQNTDLSVSFLVDELLKKPVHQMEASLRVKHVKSIGKCLKSISAIHDLSKSPVQSVLKTYLYGSFVKCDALELLAGYCDLYAQQHSLLPLELNPQAVGEILDMITRVVAQSKFVLVDVNNVFHAQMDSVHAVFVKFLEQDAKTKALIAAHIFKLHCDQAQFPSIALAKFISCFELTALMRDLELFVSVGGASEDTLTLLLCRMVDWVCYGATGDKCVEECVLATMKVYNKCNKKAVLFSVIEMKAKQLCNLILFQPTREIALHVFTFSLMTHLHSPSAFHQACPMFAKLFEVLTNDKKTASSLCELVHTLIYHFPGYPDIYSPVLMAVKGFEKPNEEKMKGWLSTNLVALPPVQESFLPLPAISRKSETGVVGLQNLGNSCYMNGILQALFNLTRFRYDVLQQTLSPTQQKLATQLQNLFALLQLSERPAIVPQSFYGVSRPEWFRLGSQQDCSEYLKYVLDFLEREQPMLTQYFTGLLHVTVRCLSCNSMSRRKELFNDLPISFTEMRSEGDGTCTLKGGDPSSSKRSVASELGECSKNVLDEAIPEEPTSSAAISREPTETTASSEYSFINMLNSYFLPEHMQGVNKYKCDTCLSLQEASKDVDIVQFPTYLTITLKRFTYDVATHQRKKLLHQLDYPPAFSLCKGCEVCSSEQNCVSAKIDEHCRSEHRYRLSAVVVHSGTSLDCGHYYSYVCRYEGACRWLLVNDSRVTVASKDSFNKTGTNFPRDTPYVCIYEKQETRSQDVTIPQQLIDMVERDNAKYLQELCEEEKRHRKRAFPKYEPPDDDDQGPSSCSGGGMNWGGGTLIS